MSKLEDLERDNDIKIQQINRLLPKLNERAVDISQNNRKATPQDLKQISEVLKNVSNFQKNGNLLGALSYLKNVKNELSK